MLVLALLAGSGVIVIGCEARDSSRQSSAADVIEVRSGSKVSLALRGGLGPIVSGQTLTRATVTMDDLELVDGHGASIALSSNGFKADLVGLQNRIGQLFSDQPVKAGHYAGMRFHLQSAWVESQDPDGSFTAHASPGVDKSQLHKGARVRGLDLEGLDSNGFATCTLAPGGLVVSGASSLALQFALSQSLAAPTSGDWVLTPVCSLVDQSALSSIEVDFAAASGADDKDLSNGFQVMVLDSNLWPISEAPLAASQSGTYGAHFAALAAFQGPFVAALIPPADYTLASGVAFSVDLKPSASCSASVTGTSLQVVSGRLLDVGTDDHCRVVQHDQHGNVLLDTSQPIGAVEDVAPTTHHGAIPQLPGNPAPKTDHSGS